jgi:hypothetical protein
VLTLRAHRKQNQRQQDVPVVDAEIVDQLDVSDKIRLADFPKD